MNISVIIPLYNKGVLINRAIDSVLSQTYQEFEIVVIDDGSTDDSAAYVKAYNDTRIKYYRKSNGRVSSARNYGITKVAYDWVVFLDADDMLLPNALETFRNMIERYGQTKIFVGKNVWIKQGQSRESYLDAANTHHSDCVYSNHPHFHLWLQKYYSAPRNTAIHRTLLSETGGFDERMSFYEDYEFALRLIGKGSVVYTTEPVAVYFQDGEGLSASSHAIEREMAYYIPEQIQTAGFWHKALLYENLEMEIFWWQQQGNEENVRFYQEMQKKHFGWIYQGLHWVRQKMIRRGMI